MEGDTIRTSGSDTLIDLWVEGRVRQIVVTREAIAATLGADMASNMDEAQRENFVRQRMKLVQAAARTAVAERPALERIVIRAAALVDPYLGGGGERRRSDRRIGDRRRIQGPISSLPAGERRRDARRKKQRRDTNVPDAPA